jgi:hypothetical protein
MFRNNLSLVAIEVEELNNGVHRREGNMRFSCGACNPWVRDADSELVVACGADAEVERTKAVDGKNPLYTKIPTNAIRPPPKLRPHQAPMNPPKVKNSHEDRQTPEEVRKREMERMTDMEGISTTQIEASSGSDDITDRFIGGDAFDYDEEKGELFYHLENKNWSEAALVARRCPEQASYFISRKNFDGSLRWRMLPIHSAIIYDAPPDILQAICAAFPEGIQGQDDRGVHPLQLAYRLKRSPQVIGVLEEYYVHAKTQCWPMKEAESIAI